MQFGKKWKFSPRYVGPVLNLETCWVVTYELDILNELALAHLVFHVSTLKYCIGDPISIISLKGLGVDESLSYEDIPVEILD